MRFENPTAFLLLLIPAALFIYSRLRCIGPAVSFSSLSSVFKAGRSFRQYFLWLPGFLFYTALVLLVTAIARPQMGMESVATSRQGVAIEMLMDISSSMDISIEAESGSMNRIDAAKQVFAEFILGNNDDLPGRKDDIIGLITFARYADTACPMTTGLPALVTIVDELEVESRPNEDGTAYGDALVLAAARLMKIDETIQSRGRQEDLIKSKVIILLTDGENNCGRHLPSQAAALAQEWGIKVYAIFLGSRPLAGGGPRFQLSATQRELEHICHMTGGICRMVHDYDSLQAVYSEIDTLEKSELNLFTDIIYREIFDWFAFAALSCLLLSILLNTTVLRRIP